MTGSRAASSVHFTSLAVVGAPSCQRTPVSRCTIRARLPPTPLPAASEIRLRRQRPVVPRERREQDVALDLTRERVKSEEGVDALQVGAGGKEDGRPSARRRRLARRASSSGSSTWSRRDAGRRDTRVRYRAAGARGQGSLASSGRCREIARMLPLARRAISAIGVVARRGDADVLPASPRARRSGAPSRGPLCNTGAARRAAHGHGPRSPASRAIRRLGRTIRSRRLGLAASPPAGPSAVCSPRRGRLPFVWWGSPSCSAISRESSSACCRRCVEAARHRALHRHRHPLRSPRVLVRADAGDALHLQAPSASRVWRCGIRRRLPERLGSRLPTASATSHSRSPPSRSSDRRHRAVRARRHARRRQRALRRDRPCQGAHGDAGSDPPHAAERADPGASRCSASRCRRSSPARCSSRRSSPGRGSAEFWSRRCRRGTTRSSWRRRRSAPLWSCWATSWPKRWRHGSTRGSDERRRAAAPRATGAPVRRRWRPRPRGAGGSLRADPRRRPVSCSATSSVPASSLRSPSISSAPFTCSAPTGSAATCGRAWSTGHASRSASACWR